VHCPGADITRKFYKLLKIILLNFLKENFAKALKFPKFVRSWTILTFFHLQEKNNKSSLFVCMRLIPGRRAHCATVQ
jgi:hypothetical protein